MIDLKNLNIILTGATGGIGGAILDKLQNKLGNILRKQFSTLKRRHVCSKEQPQGGCSYEFLTSS